ncbi:hypothetical protein AALP_AAs39584U000100 [Acetobacter orientalis]|uniref:Uncharacterized protein n=1 Tax=Acetobacter orientalis TaxID=146474 RepID=A0A2Z5ZLM0_9PROT|nr:hypothetical protein AALP_AAs39584U000100 [Acetobacter orientalis]
MFAPFGPKGLCACSLASVAAYSEMEFTGVALNKAASE